MKNIKKYRAFIIVSLFIILMGVTIYLSNPKKPSPLILFYSTTCTHCQNVASYIASSGVKNRLQFQELEVSANKTNAALLGKTAQQCQVDTSQGIGVPFFFDGEKCLIGDQDIINYLKTK